MSARAAAGGGLHRCIGIVNDEPLIRAALNAALSAAGFRLVGEADNRADALELVVTLRPDAVVVAAFLQGTSTINTIQVIHATAPGSKILVLAADSSELIGAIVAGAAGYVLRTATQSFIIDAVRAVANGESVISSELAVVLMSRVRERETPGGAGHSAALIRASLTPREVEILKGVSKGKGNGQIAQELSLSANTVANHVANILAKLHVSNRVQAAVEAVRCGIA